MGIDLTLTASGGYMLQSVVGSILRGGYTELFLFAANWYNKSHVMCYPRLWVRERNVLFNDALNTFYRRLYGIRHMVKDHSDSEKGNPLPPHRLLLSINSKDSFICTIPQTG